MIRVASVVPYSYAMPWRSKASKVDFLTRCGPARAPSCPSPAHKVASESFLLLRI